MTEHALSPVYVIECFARGDSATTAREKGEALEDAVAHVLGSVPGVRVVARDRTNAAGSEEIDLGVLNLQDAAGLGTLFEPWFFVEGKNWAGAVDSKAVRDFAGKLRARGRSFGILVAAEGITGDPGELRRANDVVRGELQDGREIVVVTREDLVGLSTSDDFVDLLLRRRSNLVMSQTVADEPWRATDAVSAGDTPEVAVASMSPDGVREALRRERERLASEMLLRAPALPENEIDAVQELVDGTNHVVATISAASASDHDTAWRAVLSSMLELGGTAVAILERVSGESWGVDAISTNATWAAPNVRDTLPGARLFEELLSYYSVEVGNGTDMRREHAAFGLIGLLIESYWRLDDALAESRRDGRLGL